MKFFDNPAIRWRTDRMFFVGMALAILTINAVGFAHAFIKTDIAEELHSTWVKVHVLLFVSWILLFVIQTTLIASQRKDLHRRIGVIGAGIAVGMIVITVISGVAGFLNSPLRPALDYFMLYVVVHVDAIDFAILAIAALLFRRANSDVHKRLMFLATVVVGIRFPMLGPLLKKMYVPHYIDQDLFVLAGILYDLISRRRVSPAYIWGGLVVLILPPAADIIFRMLVPHLVAQ